MFLWSKSSLSTVIEWNKFTVRQKRLPSETIESFPIRERVSIRTSPSFRPILSRRSTSLCSQPCFLIDLTDLSYTGNGLASAAWSSRHVQLLLRPRFHIGNRRNFEGGKYKTRAPCVEAIFRYWCIHKCMFRGLRCNRGTRNFWIGNKATQRDPALRGKDFICQEKTSFVDRFPFPIGVIAVLQKVVTMYAATYIRKGRSMYKGLKLKYTLEYTF